MSGSCSFMFRRYALSNKVCFSRYQECMSQVNFKGPDLGPFGRASAGAHVWHLQFYYHQDGLFQIAYVSVGILNVCPRSILRGQTLGRLGGVMQGHTCLAFAFS